MNECDLVTTSNPRGKVMLLSAEDKGKSHSTGNDTRIILKAVNPSLKERKPCK